MIFVTVLLNLQRFHFLTCKDKEELYKSLFAFLYKSGIWCETLWQIFPICKFFPLNLASASVFLLKLLVFFMAVSLGMASGSWIRTTNLNLSRRNHKRVCCPSASLTDQYRTLRVEPGASENEVKKAFRQLALQVGLSLLLILLSFECCMCCLIEILVSFEGILDLMIYLDCILCFFFQYHPDVCKGSNCGVQFHRINEAYDVSCYEMLLLFFFFLYVPLYHFLR